MLNVKIDRLGHQGDGIGQGPDGPVFAPRSLPGETITGVLDGGRIAMPKILVPSDNRVSAPCRHYKSCGGCALQHASDSFVADWKVDVVRRALAAQNLSCEMRPIAVSPPANRRRAALSAKRTKKGALVGFHGPASDVITPVPDCHLLTSGLRKAQDICAQISVLAGSRKGEMRFVITETETGLDLSVTGGKALDMTLQQELAALLPGSGLARLTWDGKTALQETQPMVRFDGIRVPLPAGAFLQATQAGETALRAAVSEAVGPAQTIVDLFAGCGTFALPLARHARVHAVEGDKSLTEALEAGWRTGEQLHQVTTATRDLYRNPLRPDELTKVDAVVIDPPRAGAEAQTQQLADAQVPVIAAVSCNPVTFARDARMLTEAGYRLEWVQVVDQFRWSPHVELAARFSLSHMAGQ